MPPAARRHSARSKPCCPLLTPGRSVRLHSFRAASTPTTSYGKAARKAFADEMGKTRALFDVLWERESQEQDLSTPEQRAAFEGRLKGMVGKIADTSVRAHYERELRETLLRPQPHCGARDRARPGPRKGAGGQARRNNTAPDWRLA
ncbi:MAG: hypothetical protein WDN31_20230 [Hyphomicrobium sp.]